MVGELSQDSSIQTPKLTSPPRKPTQLHSTPRSPAPPPPPPPNKLLKALKNLVPFTASPSKNAKSVCLWIHSKEGHGVFKMANFVKKTEKKKVYLREELEALRYEGIEGQKKTWVEVYCGLGPLLQKEYDGLLNHNYRSKKKRQLKKHISLNFDEGPLFDFGEESSQSADYEIVNMNEVDPASDLHPVNDDGCSIELGEEIEANDSDEDCSSIQKVAFLVTGEPDFDSGPPADGIEFLRRVRWEAAHIPKVKIAKVDSSKLKKEQTVYMPQIPEIEKCPPQLMPLKEWEDTFLADFSELRRVLSHFEMSKANNDGKMQPFSPASEGKPFCQPFETSLPENYDMSDADSSCQSSDISMHENASDLNTESVAAIENQGSISEECPSSVPVPSGTFGNHPTLSTVLGIDAVARVTMLKKHINMAETASTLSKDVCSWLFALCAAVDTPLDADTSAALRSLLRKCASLRAEKLELDGEVVMLNILATISGRYFGQSEN